MDITVGVFTLLGAVVGGAASYFGAKHAGEMQRRLQKERFDREARAVRLATIAALHDFEQYAYAAKMQAHLNLDLWRPSVDVLADLIRKPTTVHGFSDSEWHAVAAAASDARLALISLGQLPSNPFVHNLDRSNQEVTSDQRYYVVRIVSTGSRVLSRVYDALRAVGEPRENEKTRDFDELIDTFRARLAQQPMKVTEQNPTAPFRHLKVSEKGNE